MASTSCRWPRWRPLPACGSPSRRALATEAPDPDAEAGAGRDSLLAELELRRVLLVLDNLEQVPQASTVLQTILERCPEIVIIATSRRALRLRDEHEFSVEPLDLPDTPELAVGRAVRGRPAVRAAGQEGAARVRAHRRQRRPR